MKKSVSDELDRLIDEYLKLPQDTTDINGVIYLREQLSGTLFYLATEAGEARKEMMRTKSLYEAKKLHKRMEYLDEGVGRAETISRANTTRQNEDANEADGNYNFLKYKYDSAKEILSALSQKISWMKSEQQYIRAIGG